MMSAQRNTAAMHPDTNLLLKALANQHRRQILGWLRDPQKHFPDQEHTFVLGVCAGQIERKCGLAQSTVSSHLAILQHAGLITRERLGQTHYFKRREDTIAMLAKTLEITL